MGLGLVIEVAFADGPSELRVPPRHRHSGPQQGCVSVVFVAVIVGVLVVAFFGLWLDAT